MENPKVTANKPEIIELIADKSYAWCTCGHTEKGALCDGKHTSLGFKPRIFKAEKTETRALCQCKQTKNPPYCDGSHNNI